MSSKGKSKKANPTEKNNLFDNVSGRNQIIIAVAVIIIPLLVFFLPWELKNIEPVGNDYIASTGQTHQWVNWMDEHSETVLWNPNIFGGEPIYNRVTPKIIHIDTLLSYLGKIFYWVFWQMLIGGLGIFFLLKYKKIPWYAALIAAVAFILLPDWQSLIGEGHNSKLRAIMSLPWLLLSFSYFFDKRSWLGAGLFAFAFAWINRTHHFQIVFYGIMVLFFLYAYPTIKLLIDKHYKDFANLVGKFAIALILVFLTAAQPLFTTNEYSEYSIRGGNPVKIGEAAKTAQEAGGVNFNYATQWSFSPNELLGYFITRFRGGLSGEIYDGEKYSQLKGRQIPAYWGEKPFNGNYATMGIILFLFALIGIVKYRKDNFVMALTVFAGFSILLSFGRHFPELYQLLFYNLPYFSKFRAPAMIVNITFVIILLLSGYGIKAIVKDCTENDFKWIAGIFGSGIVLLILVLLMSGSYSYSTAAELKNYDANTLNVLKDIRKEFLISDTQRTLIFAVLITISVFLFLFKKIKMEWFIVSILVLSSVELYSTSSRAYKQMNLNDPQKLENSTFRPTAITKRLESSDKSMRAIVLGRDFTSNNYAYFYPLISGYSAIKLQVIQDIFDHNLYSGNSPNGINWNIVNMLSGQYVIVSQQISSPNLTLLEQNKSNKDFLYFNSDALPKAWFVKELRKLNSNEEVVLFMNENEFKPDTIALTASPQISSNQKFSGKGEIELINYEPNRFSFKVKNDEPQFMTIAEIYYPKGWKATVDGVETEILQTNYLLRGINVPAGNHEIKFEFEPQTYFTSISMVWIGDILILLLIAGGGFFVYRKKEVE